jgi:galactokinase
MNPLLADKARAAFRDAFGPGEPQLFAAPGRVNLIGEHTDYNDGFVLPMPIGRMTVVAARPIKEPAIRVLAANLGESDAFALDRPIARSPAAWANYVRGVAAGMLAEGLKVCGAELAIFGDVPLGSGLSSSASLEVAVGRAIAALSDLDVTQRQIALIVRTAEHDFAGSPCGIMDQLSAAEGINGAALLIDCRSMHTEAVELPRDVDVLIVDSGQRHANSGGCYAKRRSECEEAAGLLGVRALRDVEPGDLVAAEGSLGPNLFRRAQHVVEENRRVLQAVEALRSGDLEALGALLVQSHASMRDDFEITTARIDGLAAFMNESLAGVGGARMTGGGFGGCVIAVSRRGDLDLLRLKLSDQGVPAFLASAEASW